VTNVVLRSYSALKVNTVILVRKKKRLRTELKLRSITVFDLENARIVRTFYRTPTIAGKNHNRGLYRPILADLLDMQFQLK
jgi:hypothetical protein